MYVIIFCIILSTSDDVNFGSPTLGAIVTTLARSLQEMIPGGLLGKLLQKGILVWAAARR
jgi:hypothetical protein